MNNDSTPEQDDELLPNYDFSTGEVGKYYERYWRGRTPIDLDPDLRNDFPTSAAVNEALRKYRELVNDRRTG